MCTFDVLVSHLNLVIWLWVYRLMTYISRLLSFSRICHRQKYLISSIFKGKSSPFNYWHQWWRFPAYMWSGNGLSTSFVHFLQIRCTKQYQYHFLPFHISSSEIYNQFFLSNFISLSHKSLLASILKFFRLHVDVLQIYYFKATTSTS